MAAEWSLTEPSSDPAKKKGSPKGQKASELHDVVESSSKNSSTFIGHWRNGRLLSIFLLWKLVNTEIRSNRFNKKPEIRSNRFNKKPGRNSLGLGRWSGWVEPWMTFPVSVAMKRCDASTGSKTMSWATTNPPNPFRPENSQTFY